MNVEKQNVYICHLKNHEKKHNNQRLILCICHFKVLFASNCFLISSSIINIYHPLSKWKMCYNVTQEHKNLVLLEMTLAICQVNLEKQMNVEKMFICVILSSWPKHKNQRLILKINLVYMSLYRSPFYQLFPHLKQYKEYSLLYVKVRNALQYDTGPLEFIFTINHLGCT